VKEKLLKEKGGAKVYIIIIVLLVILCVGLGAFALIKMNEDKEDDDEKTSKKNEVSTSQTENKTDEKENKVDEDDKDDEEEKKGPVTYSGTLDMTELMGSDELKDTTWTLSIVGDDDSLEKMVIKAELEKFLKDTYESAGGSTSGVSYDEFIDEMKKQLDDNSMGSIGKELATEIGANEEDVDVSVNWIDDGTIEIEIDLSSISKEDFDIDKDESAIDSIVKALEDEGIKMKKSK